MTDDRAAASSSHRYRLLLALGLSCAALASCRQAPDSASNDRDDGEGQVTPAIARVPKSIRLVDVTEESGIELVMRCGGTPSQEILEVNGGGLALLDYDRDGDLDLFVANGAMMQAPEDGPGSRLYANRGDGTFDDVTDAAGITLHRWATGVAVGDFDGDGFDDLHVGCYGPNVLYRNRGDVATPGFEDVSERAGVDDGRWATSSAFGDLDGDGDLDLYVVNYIEFDVQDRPERASHKGISVMAGPHGLTAEHDVVYENLGDGTFRDATEAWGFLPDRAAYGLNLAIADFDQDGRQDVYVGNDSMENFLFRDRDGAGYRDEGLISGSAANRDGNNQATMGIAIGDVSGNGHADLFSTNFANDTNTLLVNDGVFFDDRTQQYGLGLLSRPYLGWTTWFLDLDHDGDEDLLSFNGHVYPEATIERMDSAYLQTPLLFERDGRRFEVVSADTAGPWLAERHGDRAAAFGDIDRDGDLDVIVSELNGPIRVLRNEAADDRDDWLMVSLVDDRAGSMNRHGLGSRIELTIGDAAQRRWIFGGGGFQSASEQAVHFGVPTAEPGTVTVTWPDGAVQRLDDVAPGQHLIVRRTG